jgi:PhnB protein
MTQIHAYLSFNGNCREAMTFYRDCIGGDLMLQPVKGTPVEGQDCAGSADSILHSSLTGDGFLLMASDMVGREGFRVGTNLSLSVACSSEEQMQSYFTNLSSGGNVIEPIKEQFWGDTFGALTDKYGVCWMFIYNKNIHSSHQNKMHHENF